MSPIIAVKLIAKKEKERQEERKNETCSYSHIFEAGWSISQGNIVKKRAYYLRGSAQTQLSRLINSETSALDNTTADPSASSMLHRGSCKHYPL